MTPDRRDAAAGSPKELAVFLLVFLLLAVLYAWAIPYFESSDEVSHFDFVKRLVLEGQLPVVTEARIFAAEEHQPPAFYVTSALVGRALLFTPLEDISGKMSLLFYGARGVSILFGLVAVYGAYLLASHFFASRRLLRLAATGIVAFNPSFVAIAAAANNDSMAAAAGIFLLLATATAAASSRLSPGRLAAAGLLVGVAALTKENLLVLLAPLAASLAIMASRSSSSRHVLAVLVAVGLPALAVGGWWYARNWALYGDPLAWNVNALLSPGNVHRELPGFNSYIMVINTLAQTYWFGFGRTSGVRAPLLVYVALWTGCALALVGLFSQLRLKKRAFRSLSGRDLGLALLAVDIGLLFLADMNYNRAFVGAGSGRYFFPVSGAIAVLLVEGLSSIVRMRTPLLALGFALVLFALGVVALPGYILPLRSPPVVVSEAQLRSQAQPVDAIFDRSLRLLGYRIENAVVPPGENVRMSLYWTAVADTTVTWTNYVHVLDSQHNMFGQYDSIPLKEGYPTLFWKKGEIWRDDIEVPLAPKAPNGAYRLEVGFYNLQTEQGALVSALGKEWVGGFLLGQLRVQASEERTVPANVVEADFGESIRLAGWDVKVDKVILYWRASSSVHRDLTVFVHFLDDASRVVAQHDGPPAMGRMPTPFWQPGEEVRDKHEVRAPAGTYMLEVGLYDARTQERVPLLAGDSSLLLGPVRVE